MGSVVTCVQQRRRCPRLGEPSPLRATAVAMLEKERNPSPHHKGRKFWPFRRGRPAFCLFASPLRAYTEHLPRDRVMIDFRRTLRHASTAFAVATVLGLFRPGPTWAQLGWPAVGARFELSATVQVDEVPSAVRARVDRVQPLLAARQWDEALETLRRLDDTPENGLLAVAPSRYVGLHDWCQLQFARLPPEALALYRRRIDPLARGWYERGIAGRRPGPAATGCRSGTGQQLRRQGADGAGDDGAGGGRFCRRPLRLGAHHSRPAGGERQCGEPGQRRTQCAGCDRERLARLSRHDARSGGGASKAGAGFDSRRVAAAGGRRVLSVRSPAPECPGPMGRQAGPIRGPFAGAARRKRGLAGAGGRSQLVDLRRQYVPQQGRRAIGGRGRSGVAAGVARRGGTP